MRFYQFSIYNRSIIRGVPVGNFDTSFTAHCIAGTDIEAVVKIQQMLNEIRDAGNIINYGSTPIRLENSLTSIELGALLREPNAYSFDEGLENALNIPTEREEYSNLITHNGHIVFLLEGLEW